MRKPALLLLLLLSLGIQAQQSNIWTDPNLPLREGFELFDKEKFGAAQKNFDLLYQQEPFKNAEAAKIAQYYGALCAIELFNPDAEFLLTQFIAQHPESPLVKQAWFQLGRYFFRDKKFKKAEEWLRQVEPSLLTEEEQQEFHFKLGYTYFKLDNFDRALAELAEVKDTDSPYASTALYYYGHIQYNQGNFESALEHFTKLSGDEVFGRIVPFYISQIYYLQKRYDLVISYAQPILDTTQSKRGPEIARLIGESYYNTNRYKEALPYLEQFRDQGGSNRTREDEYQLGFTYFKTGNHASAVPAFEKAVGNEDALGQSAWYHLGWCQLQLGQKKFARSAWAEAAKASFDTLIKEQALFDYAKLAYELGSDPYDEAVRALQDYMNAYPDSKRMDEAYAFLANIYMTTKNYRTALMSLDRIKNKNNKLKEAYQRVAFYRGIELLNDKNNTEAIRHFDLSLQYPVNKEQTAIANYWKAEAQYRSGLYAESVKGYQSFIYGLNAFNMKQFNRANYNLGYAYFKQRDYSNALVWFRKYTANYASSEVKIAADAFVRSGDCYFLKNDYSGAADSYEKAISLKQVESDYALFQRGMAQAVMGKSEAQVKTHQQILADYPNSSYVDDAKWEIARTYENQARYEEAFATYSGILMNHPQSAYVPMAKLQMAGIRYTQNRDDESKALYMEVVENHPGTPQFRDAQFGLKRIYTESGDIIGFQEMAKEKGLEQLKGAEFDSTAWESTETIFLKEGNCEKSIPQFETYLKNFPNGIFSLKALGMKADCEMKLKRIDEAAVTYQQILERPKSEYTAEANLVLGIFNRQKDQPEDAVKYFKQLELTAENADQTLQARSNVMRISQKIKDYSTAEQYARKLIEADKANEDLRQEARMIIAKYLFDNGKESEAMEEFNRLRKVNSEIGAESRYYIAQIHHNRGDFKKCEKAVYDLVDEMPSYDYWLAKSFILLADNYVKLGNVFQAKQTLQSVIDNHEGEELRNIAIRRLESINLQEGALKQEQEQPDQPNELRMNDGQDDQLFDQKKDENQEGGKVE
jgi:tetratricopeptide (TPR) repeat protein